MAFTIQPDGTQVADFEWNLALDAKGLEVTEPADDGSFFIEGLASDFGMDRQDEAFEPGAFEDGLKSYMDTNPILLYHHKTDTALGQVVTANVTPEGLHVKARVDAAEPGTIIADYVKKIKNGTLRMFSVGGKFYRRMTQDGPRIFKCDMRELSVTPLAVNPRTLFAVAGKAFESAPSLEDTSAMDHVEEALARIAANFDTVEARLADKKAVEYPNIEALKALLRSWGTDEGKASTHPDVNRLQPMLMHVVKIHTLAEDARQNASDPEIANIGKKIANHAEADSASLHKAAAKIGPLPAPSDYYGGLV